MTSDTILIQNRSNIFGIRRAISRVGNRRRGAYEDRQCGSDNGHVDILPAFIEGDRKNPATGSYRNVDSNATPSPNVILQDTLQSEERRIRPRIGEFGYLRFQPENLMLDNTPSGRANGAIWRCTKALFKQRKIIGGV
jgi:hypothetical protein